MGYLSYAVPMMTSTMINAVYFLYPDIQKHLLISSEIVGRTSLSVIRCLFSVVWAECYTK